MKYAQNLNNEKNFRAITGITPSMFNEMLPYFEYAYYEYMSCHDMRGKRITRTRKHTIQSRHPLPSVADRLFFLLYFLKTNALQEVLSDRFGMDQEQCCLFIHTLTDIFKIAIKDMGHLPAENMAEFRAKLDEQGGDRASHLLIHDAVEREIPRPYNPEKQEDYYSGKKKKHTVKNAVITTVGAVILFVSQTVCGAVHDKKIADEHYYFPYACTLMQDTGYQGYAPENAIIVQPAKKPKGKDLTAEQKAENREISSRRIRVEHAIGGAKILHVVQHECRLRANDYVGKIFHIAAGIHNWRMSAA